MKNFFSEPVLHYSTVMSLFLSFIHYECNTSSSVTLLHMFVVYFLVLWFISVFFQKIFELFDYEFFQKIFNPEVSFKEFTQYTIFMAFSQCFALYLVIAFFKKSYIMDIRLGTLFIPLYIALMLVTRGVFYFFNKN